jgi:hypothetical protein
MDIRVVGLYHDTCPAAKKDAEGTQEEFPQFIQDPAYQCDDVYGFVCEKCGTVIGVEIKK